MAGTAAKRTTAPRSNPPAAPRRRSSAGPTRAEHQLELELVDARRELSIVRSNELTANARRRHDATSLYIIAVVLVVYGVWVATIAGKKMRG